MSNRFLHDSFDCTVVCSCCGGNLELRVEGHFYEAHFVLNGATNKLTNQELVPNDEQRKTIEEKGDSRYQVVLETAKV